MTADSAKPLAVAEEDPTADDLPRYGYYVL